MFYETILYEIKDGIGRMIIGSPLQLNALNEKAFQEIKGCILNAITDGKVKMLIIAGTGTSFPTGRDLRSFSCELSDIVIAGPVLYDSVRDVVDAIQA